MADLLRSNLCVILQRLKLDEVWVVLTDHVSAIWNVGREQKTNLTGKHIFYVFVCAQARSTEELHGKTFHAFVLHVGASGSPVVAHDITIYARKTRGMGRRALHSA